MMDPTTLVMRCLRCECDRFMVLDPREDVGVYDVRCEACGTLKLVVDRPSIEKGRSSVDQALWAQLRKLERKA